MTTAAVGRRRVHRAVSAFQSGHMPTNAKASAQRANAMLGGMDQVIAWAGFLGAWLLVAGPLYQGALELQEEDIDRELMAASVARVPRPQPPSAWWWLLPPVMYLILRRRAKAFRHAVFAQLTLDQQRQFTIYMRKAIGWFTVAAGATLLAAEQTWRVTEAHRWSAWLFWLLATVMLSLAVLNTALRLSRKTHAGAAGAVSADYT